MELRRATGDDAREVVQSYTWLFAPPGRRPPVWDEQRAEDSVRRLVTSTDCTLYVALFEGRIVGFVTVYMDLDSVRFGRRAWIEDLAVHPDFRSRGIGKQLLDEAKRWGKSHGADYIELESGEGRVDAHRFYERERPLTRSKSYGWRF
ncbi:MAG: GNAT family N-acetyltransferase [Thermoplasmata archaeon]